MKSIPEFGDISSMQSLNDIISSFQIEVIVCTKQHKNMIQKNITENKSTRIQILHISTNLKQRSSDIGEILEYVKNNGFKIEQKTQCPVFHEKWLLSDIVLLGVGHTLNKQVTMLLSNDCFRLLASEKYSGMVYHTSSTDLEADAYDTCLLVCDDLEKDGIGMMFGYVNNQQYSRLKIIDEWDKIEKDVCNICKQQSISCGRDIIDNTEKLLRKMKSDTDTPLAIMRIIRDYRNMLAHPLNNKRSSEKFFDRMNTLRQSTNSALLKQRVEMLRFSGDDDDYAATSVWPLLPPESELKNYSIPLIDMIESGVPFVLVFIRMLKIWLADIKRII